MKIERILRLGKTSNEQPDRVRPILVELSSNSIKSEIMKNAKKLKDFGNIAISNDLTKTQREEHKKLLSEAKRLNDSNVTPNHIHKVVGPPGKEHIKLVPKN